jgi:hypothetical protein
MGVLCALEGTLRRWSRLHLQSLAPTNTHWACMVSYGQFCLCETHKEGLCHSSGDINKLMMIISPINFCCLMVNWCAAVALTSKCKSNLILDWRLFGKFRKFQQNFLFTSGGLHSNIASERSNISIRQRLRRLRQSNNLQNDSEARKI